MGNNAEGCVSMLRADGNKEYNSGLAQCLSVCISMIHRQEEALLRAGSLILSTRKKKR